MASPLVAFTHKGGCPLKPVTLPTTHGHSMCRVAFTHKGGCPLKHRLQNNSIPNICCSIHPQGWVPNETQHAEAYREPRAGSSIHPQGWVPIETGLNLRLESVRQLLVAFTHKGGCPLKQKAFEHRGIPSATGSIHPQGWVPIETNQKSFPH